MIYDKSLIKLKEEFARASASRDLDFAVAYIPADGLLPVELHVLENSGAAISRDRINSKEYWCLCQGPDLAGDIHSLIKAAREEAKINPNKRILVERLAT